MDEAKIERVGEAVVPTRWGSFRTIAHREPNGLEHLTFLVGDVASAGEAGVLARIHSECLTGDVFGSQRCDCGAQLDAAMRRIHDSAAGALVYLRGHEGRGIGIGEKIRAYALQDEGLDTIDANTALGLPVDARSYVVGAAILRDLGVSHVRVMTNNPAKWLGLQQQELTVLERVALPVAVTDANRAYLQSKRDRLGHLIELD
jgi:3,4-dihydroxy 2-butanone 4-phosphate synthase/GTP cyclohydrolase II